MIGRHFIHNHLCLLRYLEGIQWKTCHQVQKDKQYSKRQNKGSEITE